jgi:pyruvate/2-oxoglutarate dehydrogenase complex dihydrolipoamide dehydrogenase (E3) component
MSYQYQIIVIGSGSAGKDAALLAARAGRRTLLIESDRLGGTGIHRGCHAVRALRACATHYDRVTESDRLGIYLDKVATNWSNWLEVQHRACGRLAEGISRALEQAWVEVKFGRGELFDPHTVVITDELGKKQTVTSEYIILATGSRPSFPGNEKARVLNSDQFLSSGSVPKHLFVIGGGYVGCELASLSRRSSTPKRLPTWIRNPVSSRTSLFRALTSDSPFFTLPPGSVHNFNPAAWRTGKTLLAASSIQAITDTSLVGRSRETLGVALRMLWLNH